jgi:hypothetical protein
MPPRLSQHFNKPILVSLPALFEDARCRPYKLVGAELQGLWLQSDELTRRLLPEKHGDVPKGSLVFVPFAQVGAVLALREVSAAPPVSAQNKVSTAPAAPANDKAKSRNDPEAKNKPKRRR